MLPKLKQSMGVEKEEEKDEDDDKDGKEAKVKKPSNGMISTAAQNQEAIASDDDDDEEEEEEEGEGEVDEDDEEEEDDEDDDEEEEEDDETEEVKEEKAKRSSNATSTAVQNQETLAGNEEDKEDTNASPKLFKCPICLILCKTEVCMVLKGCLHCFCHSCLASIVNNTDNGIVKCPSKINNLVCETVLHDNDIKTLVSGEKFDAYQFRAIITNAGERIFHCKTSDCTGWGLLEGGTSICKCPTCDKWNCLPCGAMHEGLSCEDYKEATPSGVDNRELQSLKTKVDELTGTVRELLDIIHQQAKELRENHEKISAGQGKMKSNKQHDLKLLMDLSNANIVPNYEPFECPICTTQIEANEGVLLRDCFHSFCRDCLGNTVKHAEDVIVHCPNQDHGPCATIIHDPEIRSLLSEEDYDAYQSRSLRTAEGLTTNSFHCLTPDCTYWYEIVGNVESFRCPACNTENCCKCKALHGGDTCADYQRKVQQIQANNLSEEELKKLVVSREVMHCPKCGIMLTKTTGCDFMRCAVCKTAICWATRGPRWGPAGDGDNSGGCGCKMEKRCHPECEGCHF